LLNTAKFAPETAITERFPGRDFVVAPLLERTVVPHFVLRLRLRLRLRPRLRYERERSRTTANKGDRVCHAKSIRRRKGQEARRRYPSACPHKKQHTVANRMLDNSRFIRTERAERNVSRSTWSGSGARSTHMVHIHWHELKTARVSIGEGMSRL
jgi:hypothetical protein